MEFRTIVNIEKPDFEIMPMEKMLFVGSCFADNIGRRFVDNKFNAIVNPSLTGLTDRIEGQVIDVEHNPFMGLVISIKDNLGRIFFGQSKYFKIA